MAKKQNKKDISINQYQQGILALEELEWLLDSPRGRSLLSSLPKMIENLREINNYRGSVYVNRQNIRSLVGVLPEFFQNSNIFRTNADIEQFAREVLGVNIINFEKKSRTEIIGVIVCSVPNFEDSTFEVLGKYLSNIVDDEKKCSQVAKEKETTNFSWNDTISKLFK
nr:hypothetical protein [Bacteroides intestinalis]